MEALEYTAFNLTFPRNLLVIVGKYDILFDTNELMNKVLPPAFGTTGSVVPGMLYGDFSSQTSRKLVISPTKHLFEPLDPTVICESIDWVEKAVGKSQEPRNLIYIQRELGFLIALFGMLGIPLLALYAGKGFVKKSSLEMVEKEELTRGKWRLYLMWGSINLALFIPFFIVGLVISFPPLIFGSSVAWWLFASGLLGLVLITKFSKRLLGRKLTFKNMLNQAVAKEGIVTASIVFVILYVGVTSANLLLAFDFRIVVPILKNLSSVRRVLAFAAFIPFFLPYFMAEGLYLNRFAPKMVNRKGIWSKLQLTVEKIFGKMTPITLLLSLQHATKASLDFWLIPIFFGFLLDLLWLIIPIFTIAIVFSSCFYEATGDIFSGAFFDTILLAWIASATFPF